MSFRGVLALGFVVMVVMGGVVVWTAWDAISDKLDQAESKQAICSTLEDDEREALVGVETPTILTDVEGALDPYTCRWATEDFETVPTYVQAVAAPADAWAADIRSALVARGAALDPELRSRVRKLIDRPLATPADGCRFAKALFQGKVQVVAPSADSQGNPMMVAQSCRNGTYSAVMVASPSLVMDRQLARRTARALRTVEERNA